MSRRKIAKEFAAAHREGFREGYESAHMHEPIRPGSSRYDPLTKWLDEVRSLGFQAGYRQRRDQLRRLQEPS